MSYRLGVSISLHINIIDLTKSIESAISITAIVIIKFIVLTV